MCQCQRGGRNHNASTRLSRSMGKLSGASWEADFVNNDEDAFKRITVSAEGSNGGSLIAVPDCTHVVSALIKVDPGVLKDCGPSRCARWSVRRAVSLDRTISDATRGASLVMFDYRQHCGGARPGVRARAPRGTQPSTPIARAGQSRLPLEACNPYSGSTPPKAYSRPDRTWEQPLRAAAVQGWRAAPPEGLVLDWREHDGSIGRLGA